ncbi:hypothetical protein QBC46DRAFT_353130 [Diplogelasinospora grovesii]|uniref:Uncharacterized protein n=1 Tax=Diplogelasinospora grovesii TaxID=303347 RepID=A0AAN6S5Y2_9PEZI|nr:hypothetical protein QBC46DRAFT_353130 [Diplogelasinospora grovesii]
MSSGNFKTSTPVNAAVHNVEQAGFAPRPTFALHTDPIPAKIKTRSSMRSVLAYYDDSNEYNFMCYPAAQHLGIEVHPIKYPTSMPCNISNSPFGCGKPTHFATIDIDIPAWDIRRQPVTAYMLEWDNALVHLVLGKELRKLGNRLGEEAVITNPPPVPKSVRARSTNARVPTATRPKLSDQKAAESIVKAASTPKRRRAQKPSAAEKGEGEGPAPKRQRKPVPTSRSSSSVNKQEEHAPYYNNNNNNNNNNNPYSLSSIPPTPPPPPPSTWAPQSSDFSSAFTSAGDWNAATTTELPLGAGTFEYYSYAPVVTAYTTTTPAITFTAPASFLDLTTDEGYTSLDENMATTAAQTYPDSGGVEGEDDGADEKEEEEEEEEAPAFDWNDHSHDLFGGYYID